MATWGCRHCTYENEHGMTVCAICGNPNLAAEGAPSSDIEFELFRDILDEIRRDAGGGFDVDAALEQIAVMLGAADVPSLLMSVGPRGLEYVQAHRAGAAAPRDAPRAPDPAPPQPPPPQPPQPQREASSASSNDGENEDGDEPNAQSLVSRIGGLDGLESWPPPGIYIPQAVPGDDEGQLGLARAIVLASETELRRMAQLGRPDTSAWHALKFTGAPADEKEHVMGTIIPAWGSIGGDIILSLHKFWEGERDEETLTKDRKPGTVIVIQVLLRLMALMEEKIAACPGGDIFSRVPKTSDSAAAVWGLKSYHVYSGGDEVEIRWDFNGTAEGAPDFVDVHLHRAEGQGIVRLRSIEDRVRNIGTYRWTVPGDLSADDLGPENTLRVVVVDSTARAKSGHSCPFSVAVEGAPAGGGRASGAVRMADAKVGLVVVRGPDWRFGDQDGGIGHRGTITQILLPGVVEVRWTNGHTNRYVTGGPVGEFHLAHAGPARGPDSGVRFRGQVFGVEELSALDRLRMFAELVNANETQGHADADFLSSLAPKAATQADLREFGDELCFCMVDYEIGDKVVTTPCGHHYHEECLKKWLEGSTKCPVCNKEFPAEMHKSVLRTSSVDVQQELVVDQMVSPFDVVLQEGDDWTCPECIPLVGIPADDRFNDEGGCSRCGVSRNPWSLIAGNQETFHTVAQCVVDNFGVSQLNSTMPATPFEEATEVRRISSNSIDLKRAEVPLGIRRDRVMQGVVEKLHGNGWAIREPVQRMLQGERREWELVTCTPDHRSAVITRHLLRLVSDPRRLDRARQMVAPSPVDEVRSKHFFERYAVVFKAIVARLKYGQGPATADAAGSSQGLLCIFESMGWEIGLGVHRMIRGRFDMKEHWRAVDATSKVLLEHIADLVKGDEAAVAVDENEFVTATIRLLLNNVCSETERLGDADLVLFLGTFKELAENLVKDPTNPKYRAINNAPGSTMYQRLGRWHFGQLALYLLGYESGPAPPSAAPPPSRSSSKALRGIIGSALMSGLSGLRKRSTTSPSAAEAAPDFGESSTDDPSLLWLSDNVSSAARKIILDSVTVAQAKVMGADVERQNTDRLQDLIGQLAAALE